MGGGGEGEGWTVKEAASKKLVAQADLEPSEVDQGGDGFGHVAVGFGPPY
jgi:hypothetical protein